MGKRVILGVLAVALVAPPARAHTSPDWNKVDALIRALPSNYGSEQPGSIPPAVVEQIHRNIVPLSTAAQSWEIVYTDSPSGGPDIVRYFVRPDGLLAACDVNCDGRFPALGDPAGLVWSLSHTASFVLSGPISVASPGDVNLTHRWIESGGSYMHIIDENCQLHAVTPSILHAHCTGSWHNSYHNADASSNFNSDFSNEVPKADVEDFDYRFDPNLGIFLRVDAGGNTIFASALDWRIGNGMWRSKQTSAQPTAAQKDQARALFARGFDLYKSGDLTGARALMEAGLKIDPGNYLGWFTLAEIGRSTVVQNPAAPGWGATARKVGYQHTIDLAPDSPEAALAKGYLAALH